MTDWNQKIVAHLHDPPEKAFDYSKTHVERSARHLANLQVPDAAWKSKEPDHLAAAADRFIFPASQRKEGDRWMPTGVGNLGEGVQFKHPLTGEAVLGREAFPDEDQAHDIISRALPDFADKEERIKFWLLWRLWLQFSVEAHRGKDPKAGVLACLPADTRIPDGTIWHHMSVVSALEATRDTSGVLRPAFLIFQLGPVQEFIAQGRSTRDLWSGSYLLSWMMAHAMKALADEYGPDCIIFPSLKGQPLYDWLEQEKLKQAFHTSEAGDRSKHFWETHKLDRNQDLALTPNLPNRFLAVVPESAAAFVREKLEAVFGTDNPDSEWSRLCRACWEFLPAKEELPRNAQSLWQHQVRSFWQLSWQLWPWQEVKPSLNLFATIPLGRKSLLHDGRKVALAIPDNHKDSRCYAGDPKEIQSPGWAWSAHYQLLAHRLDARRQTRDFKAWQSSGTPGHKDHLSGKEEAIATTAWLGAARKSGPAGHLFRHDDELGAINLIKRVWHKAYLEKHRSFRSEQFKFLSVLGIAAAPWTEKVLGAMKANSDSYQAFLEFRAAVEIAQGILDFDLSTVESESDWLRRVDASVFQESFWNNLKLDSSEEERLRDGAKAALAHLIRKADGGSPGKYFAVLALDGDQIGKWLSGEKTPAVGKVITEAAAQYFRGHVQAEGINVDEWLKSGRPLSPSYHLQFSEALANFGLYCAARIVEAHHGQLIYSGGDDVLAMLPAEEAIACAQGLRLAFQGRSEELARHAAGRYAHLFHPGASAGFIHLKDGDWHQGCRRPSEPSWPLLVPGPEATVSVGISIGHIKEPLQDMVREAQAAERRAKAPAEREVRDDQQKTKTWKLNHGWDRDALAVTLFKHSGETVQWGAKFDSPAFPLLELFQRHYRTPMDAPEQQMPISGKFPYRVAELLGKFKVTEPLTRELRDIALAEFTWTTGKQIRRLGPITSDAELKHLREELRRKAATYLDHLLNFTWDRLTTNGGKQSVQAARPLTDFIHLFALEAFIARQGE